MSGWRSSAPFEYLAPRATQAPPDEPHGPCMYAGCPRTGTVVTGDLVACGFHRGLESTRAGTRIIGQRAGDVT